MRGQTPDGVVVFVLAVLTAMSSFIGFGMGSDYARDRIRRQAVEAGVGEWISDQKTGEARFRFIPRR